MELEGKIRAGTIKNIQIRQELATKKMAAADTDAERLAVQNEMNQLTQELAAVTREDLTASR